MSDGDLIKWIRYLHAAAAVPKGDPDYADAQAAVAQSRRKIAAINRAANRREDYVPTALETAGMTGLASTAGAAASLPVSPALAALGVPPSPFNGALEALIAKLAGDATLNARGHDPAAVERGAGAHPTAAFLGEMTPTLLMLLAGKLGGKPAYNAAAARLKIQPSEAIPVGRYGLPEINMDLRPAGTSEIRPVRNASVADALDRPTFLRRAAPPPEPPVVNPASNEIDRLLMLLRGPRRGN